MKLDVVYCRACDTLHEPGKHSGRRAPDPVATKIKTRLHDRDKPAKIAELDKPVDVPMTFAPKPERLAVAREALTGEYPSHPECLACQHRKAKDRARVAKFRAKRDAAQ